MKLVKFKNNILFFEFIDKKNRSVEYINDFEKLDYMKEKMYNEDGKLKMTGRIFCYPEQLEILKNSEHLFSDDESKIIFDEAYKNYFDSFKNNFEKFKNQLDEKSFDGTKELRQYQKDDLKFLINYKRAFNFSEMRTGKTPTTLMLCKNIGKKALVIVPPSLVQMTWLPQIKEWLGIEALSLFKKNKNGFVPMKTAERFEVYEKFFKSDEFNFLVVSKDTWKIDQDKIDLTKNDFTLIVDEAHFLNKLRSKSKSTKQAWSVYETSTFASRVYLLTGTPIVNYPYELFGMLKVINDKVFVSRTAFVDYFFGYDVYNAPKPDYRDQKYDEVFKNDFLKPFSVMRKLEEVCDFMPEVQNEVYRMLMLPQQEKEYWRVYKESEHLLFERDNKEEERNPEVLGLIQNLRSIMSGVEVDNKFVSNKFDFITNYFEDIERTNEKILIVSSFSKIILKRMQEHLREFDPLMITGSTPMTERTKIVDKIQNGESKILISNIKCIKEGITLDKIDTLIFMERSWSPADNDQVVMRFMPTKKEDVRKSPKTIIDLVSLPADEKSFLPIFNSLDEQVISTLERKQNINESINNLKE
jgi:superfamily II DNA or RNA helicase